MGDVFRHNVTKEGAVAAMFDPNVAGETTASFRSQHLVCLVQLKQYTYNNDDLRFEHLVCFVQLKQYVYNNDDLRSEHLICLVQLKQYV